MPTLNLSPIYEPQYIAAGAAGLVLALPGGGTVIQPNIMVQILSIRVTNVTAAPVSLSIWRVPAGSISGNDNLLTPPTVIIPVAVNTYPHFDLTVLWGAVLRPGDAIFAFAGAATALVIQGDGAVIV